MSKDAKEILIAYVSTLSEKKAKEAYQILLERFEVHKARCLNFNRDGIEATPPEGKIRLTPNQFQLIIENMGEAAFKGMCQILYDYITHLEERAPAEVVARQRLKEYQKISHYYKMTKGWVAQRYTENNPTIEDIAPVKFLNFEDIKNKKQAIEYINSIPKPLRYDNNEVTFLIMEYGINNDEIN